MDIEIDKGWLKDRAKEFVGESRKHGELNQWLEGRIKQTADSIERQKYEALLLANLGPDKAANRAKWPPKFWQDFMMAESNIRNEPHHVD